VCPYGQQHRCVNYNGQGTKSCSNIACKRQTATQSNQFDTGWQQDDGRRDSAGQCLDQTLLFSGKSQACRPSGSQTAYKNCCVNKTGLTSTDSSGASAEQYGKMKAIYAVLAAAKAGAAAIAAGTSAGAAVQQSLASSLDPASFAISASIYLTMSYLAKACGQTDMETAIMKDSGLCVEVGTYCSEEWKPFGCVQKKTTYCCFNSKIARIFHQQGRSQLTSFNKTQLFGNTESPDCRGYTSEEFSVLDFDRINLDEYINGINNKQKTNGLNEQLTRKTQQLEQQL
jgi:conjugal transfer mating pair stabilization protein TraN